MVILTIIMATLTSVLVSASHTEIDVNKRFQQQNDRTGLDMLRREIHRASAVTDTSGTSLTVGTAYANRVSSAQQLADSQLERFRALQYTSIGLNTSCRANCSEDATYTADAATGS